MEDEIKKAITELAKRAQTSAATPDDSMKLAQATLNMAHALNVLKGLKT